MQKSMAQGLTSTVSAKNPRGRYVYAWFNNSSPFPFYVGKGVGDRAWRRHMCKGLSAYCTRLRCDSVGFHCQVVRDNMTNEGAMLLESSLVDFFFALGGCAGNQISPLRRQEVPPLWLHEVLRQFAEDIKCRESVPEEIESDVESVPEPIEIDSLLEQIIKVLDETEGQGKVCLPICLIAEKCGSTSERVFKCMKKHGLNP